MTKRTPCDCSRRSFLHGSGLTLAGFTLGSLFPTALVNMALAGPISNRRLLFIYLDGGCDVINTLIPHGDPDYNTTNRPNLFIPRASAINLNGFTSLHPSLADLKPIYDAGDLAVVHRIGYPNISQSHFDGYKVLHGGDPNNLSIFDGWLYRYVVNNGLTQSGRLPVMTLNWRTPRVVQGVEGFVNVDYPDGFGYSMWDPLKAKYRNTWRRMNTRRQKLEAYRPLLNDTGVKLVDTLDEYQSWDQANWNPKDPNTGWSLFPVDDATNPPDAGGPNGKKFPVEAYEFFRNIKLCALALLESDTANGNGTRVAGTEFGGWDTHDGQGTLGGGAHPEQLKWLAYGMKGLRIALSGAATDPRNYTSIWDDVAVVTFTEFGRTSRENGGLGTDHGQASFSLVAGGQVRGGTYNGDAATWESHAMFAIDGEYLSHRTDYRALFWEILRDHMGAPSAQANTVFPGYSSAGLTELNLFAP